MKDLIRKNTKRLDIPLVMEAIKERMIEHRFNIDDYNKNKGTILGRRNNMGKVVLGLNRGIAVSVVKEKDDLSIELKWSLLPTNCLITAFEFFIVSMAALRALGINRLLISIFVGVLGAAFNLGLFSLLRLRLNSKIKRDLHDLEKAVEEGKRKGRMGIF